MKNILKEVKNLIESDKIEEIITTTNGERKTILKLKQGGSIVYHGDEAIEVLIFTSKY